MRFAPANRIPSLDGLRAMSILLVIIGHLWGGMGRPVLLSAFGVHVFFVLSGYLITRLLQQEQERTGRINLLTFYQRRCFRIFPAAFTYILIIALISPGSRPGLIYAATYTVSYHPTGIPLFFQHLWSLSVEEQFYLLWPLALLISFRHRAWVAWFAMAVAAGFRVVVLANPSHYSIDYLHFSFLGTMDSIAAGCLLAIYEPWLRERWKWMADVPAIAIAVPVTAWAVESAFWNNATALWGAVPLLIAFWVFLLVQRRDWILNNPVASAIGVLSYSLYLWQQPFAAERKHGVFVTLSMLAACAVASYLLVERPMLKLGASIKARKRVAGYLDGKLELPATE